MAEPYFILKGFSKKTKKAKPNAKALVVMKMNLPNRDKYVKSTGISVPTKYWSFRTSTVTSAYTGSSEINESLRSYSSGLTNIVTRLRSKSIPPSRERDRKS